jgi:lipoyl(octanoyl) transferase
LIFSPKRPCIVKDWGLVDYHLAWQWQKNLVSERLNDPSRPDLLVLAEHPPVYTLGTGAKTEFLNFRITDPNYSVYRVDRGGEVTHHCPGQLVGYPILQLGYYQQDLHWYLRQLEEVLINLLAGYGLEGERIAGLTGVWVAGYKVAAIGIKAKRWISMHGFALNVCPDLTGFKDIVPCGISDRPVGSLAQFIPQITLEQVKRDLQMSFAQIFGVEIVLDIQSHPKT